MVRYPAIAARHDAQTTVVHARATTGETDEARWVAVEAFAFGVFSFCCTAFGVASS